MARSGPELNRPLKHAHATPRDSFSFCLKDRTSLRRLTTPEMGKKDKQKLEHKASQSSCTLPTVWVYQCLVFPSKRTEIASTLRFHVTCPRYVSMHKFAQTLIGEYMGFHHLSLRTIVPGPYLLNSDTTHSQV